jgi:phosphatidate cytidylyltransferase
MTQPINNFLIRLLTGAIFVAVVLAAMLLGRGLYFVLLVLIACICSMEFMNLARTRAQRWLGVAYIFLAMAAMAFFPVIGAGMSSDAHGPWSDCPWLAARWPDGWDFRVAPAFIVTVWANDVFAYLVGSPFGRHKMAPRLSPHKSWEGFVGGVVGAMIVAGVIGKFWIGEIWRIWIPFGLVVSLAAVAGDLVESRFKRAVGVKDSGRLLPGHGGLLDRFDATLGAVPAAFLFFLITYLTR